MENQNSGSGSQRGGSGNFANDPERASEAGKKGAQSRTGEEHGSAEANDSIKSGGSGSFANDPERASEAGRKGGEHSHGGRSR